MNDGDDKDSDSARFVNALSGAIMLFAFIIHPFLAFVALIVWAVGAAMPARPYQPPLSSNQRLEQACLTAGQEYPPLPAPSEARPSFAKPILKGIALYAALIAALIVVAAIAGIIARVSHSDPAEIFRWIIAWSILAFVVCWAMWWRPAQIKPDA